MVSSFGPNTCPATTVFNISSPEPSKHLTSAPEVSPLLLLPFFEEGGITTHLCQTNQPS